MSKLHKYVGSYYGKIVKTLKAVSYTHLDVYKRQACEYVDRFFSMNFRDKLVSMTNFKVDDETIGMGCLLYTSRCV